MNDAPWWLGPLLTVSGFAIGIAGSAWIQDRSRKVKNRATARALRSDLHRIREELGLPDGVSMLGGFSGRPISPTLHPWLTSLIPDMADENDAILPAMMVIERDLANLRSSLEGYWKLVERRDSEQQKLEVFEDAGISRVGELVEQRRVMKSLSTSLEHRLVSIEIPCNRALEGIAKVLPILDTIANRVHPLVPWGAPETFDTP